MSISGAWGDPKDRRGGRKRERGRKEGEDESREGAGFWAGAPLEQGGASQGSGCCQGRTPSTDGGEFEGTMLEDADGVLVLRFLLRIRRQGR